MNNPVEKQVKKIVGIILKFCINNSGNTSFITGNSKNQMGMFMAFRSLIYLINCHIFWHSFILFFSYLQENWILTRFFFFWNWYLYYPEAKQSDYLSFPSPQIYLLQLCFSEYQPKFCICIFYQSASFKY